MVRAVSLAVAAHRLPIFAEELGFLIAGLELCDEDTASLADVTPAYVDPGSPFAFLALPPAVADRLDSAGGYVPDCLDHTTGDGGDDGMLDAVDNRAARTAAGKAGVLGLWRSWRIAAVESPWPPPKRVYLVEVGSRGIRRAVTDEIARTLALAGESDPLVEVWAAGDDVPEYQAMARYCGALLWAAAPRRRIRVAPVFEDAVESHRRRQLTDDIERNSVLDYLDAGPVLLTTDLLGDDMVEPRGARVPMDVRTDGTWIWTDATAYYLRHYLIAPHPDLLAHIRVACGRPARPDTVALFRAMATLSRPDSTLH